MEEIPKNKSPPFGMPSKKAKLSGGLDQTSQRYELIPKDQPIVQRAFFRGIGTKAIMVGFPGGINLGYDSANAQPKLLWVLYGCVQHMVCSQVSI